MTATAVRKPFPLSPWLEADATARTLAASPGRTIDTGWNIGVGRVVRLNKPSKARTHGSVRVVNHLGESDTFDFVLLCDRLRSGAAKFVDALDEVRDWVFKTRSGATHAVGRGDPLFCVLDNTRVRFERMVDCSASSGVPGDWMVEVSSNYDGKVLPDLRHPSQVFAYGM